jgi:hypothetical protein
MMRISSFGTVTGSLLLWPNVLSFEFESSLKSALSSRLNPQQRASLGQSSPSQDNSL